MFLRVNTACEQKQHGKTWTAHGDLATVERHPSVPCVDLNLGIDNGRRGDSLNLRD